MISASSCCRDLKQSHSMRMNRRPIAIMRRSCSDSPLTASQMDGAFGSDSRVVRLRGLDELAQPKLEMVGGQCHTLEMALEEVAIIVGQLLPGAARAKMAAQRRHDQRLDLGGGNAADQSGRRGLILQQSLGDVIAVAGAALVGVGWAHAVATSVKKAPAQDGGRAPQPAAPRARLGRKLGLHRREQGTIHNRRLFAAMDLAPVDNLADIEAVLEQMGERPHAKALPADGPAVRQPPRLAANSPPIEILRQRADGAKLEIARKDRANRRSLGWYHEDLLVHRRIAERHRAADPKAFALGGSDLVAHSLPDQLAFELGK